MLMAREKTSFKRREVSEEIFKFPEISEMERRLELARKTQRPEKYEKSKIRAVKTEQHKEMPANFLEVRKKVEKEFVGGIKELAKQLKIKL